MATLEVSLSRAHKIAERLKELMKDTLVEVASLAEPVTFTSRPAPSALEDLTTRASRVLALADKATTYSKAWASVRGAIAGENHKRGIDKMLTELETLSKLTAAYKEVSVHAKAEGYLPSEIGSYIPENTAYGFRMSVNPMRDPAVSKTVTATLAALQREAIQLSDAIAEANAPRVKLDLPEDIVAEVTGVAREH